MSKKTKYTCKKPCPFCGNSEVTVSIGKTVIIECTKCKVLFIRNTFNEAVTAWNARNINPII